MSCPGYVGHGGLVVVNVGYAGRKKAVVEVPGSRAIVGCPSSVGYCRFVVPRTILWATIGASGLAIPKR